MTSLSFTTHVLTSVFFTSGESGSTLSLYVSSFSQLLVGFIRKSGPWIHCYFSTKCLGDIPLEPSSAAFDVALHNATVRGCVIINELNPVAYKDMKPTGFVFYKA